MAAAERAQREIGNLQIAEQLVSLTTHRDEAEVRETELQAESEQVRGRLVEIEHHLRGARQEMDTVRDRRGELSAQVAKLQSDQQHMADTAMNELGVTADTLLNDESIAKLSGEPLALGETDSDELRT